MIRADSSGFTVFTKVISDLADSTGAPLVEHPAGQYAQALSCIKANAQRYGRLVGLFGNFGNKVDNLRIRRLGVLKKGG